ncbi:DUF808 domain-containing protein [Pseudochryseolinea flava]|uniref:DUF808 domain-containing protein n=1 Tax=Pseudochryseolinea flava TaxID=2059302 RepID=A0A364Y5G2_9BACT|nr:DUF808 family protein [Pseudochryseolinea flava]RAW02193.1 DUF808 domain-containing protein [Pseudochryseolinea flava]
MASGFFSILDDVAALMDDVAIASKIATRKTAGILGDDLAVNAEKATGFMATRELPVLWAISKGSLINKLIIVPVALLLTAFFPVAIKVVLVLGAFYLAYEAAEKIVEFLFHRAKTGEEVIEEPKENGVDVEKSKIKSAITTDFILSVEIVIIALGTVMEESLTIQIITVSVVSLLATVGVYGIVALIVRMDDIGYRMIKRAGDRGIIAKIGHLLVKSLPLIIKFFGFVGTIALLLVSGGIFEHSIPFIHHNFNIVPLMVKEFFTGLIAGLIAVGAVTIVKRMFFKKK